MAMNVTISKATEDMKGGFGPPPKVGWSAALDKTGKVRMVAGKGALHLLTMNAGAQGWKIVPIVADRAPRYSLEFTSAPNTWTRIAMVPADFDWTIGIARSEARKAMATGNYHAVRIRHGWTGKVVAGSVLGDPSK